MEPVGLNVATGSLSTPHATPSKTSRTILGYNRPIEVFPSPLSVLPDYTYSGVFEDARTWVASRFSYRHTGVLVKEIIWESEIATDSEGAVKEAELIRQERSNDPSIGYNRWPKFT